MEVLMAVMTGIMRSISDSLKETYDRLKGVTYKDVRFLKELRSMQAVVSMAGGMPLDDLDLQDKIWADELRENLYDTEDILANIMVHADGTENTRCFKGLRTNITNLFSKDKTPYQIAAATKEMKTTVERTADRRARYKVSRVRPPAQSTRLIHNRMALYNEFTDLVGIDGAMDDLTKSLGMNERDGVSNKQLKIVSLSGIGGVGKTTLAGQVFQKLKSQFDFTAFVPLSPNSDMRVVCHDMLREVHEGKYDDSSLDQTKIISKLHEFLQNKRYFIVIDDISEKESWLTIKHAMVDNNLGSIIITTTRNFDVAKEVGGAYELKPLSTYDSKMLFYRSIYREKCPRDKFIEVSSDDEFTEVSLADEFTEVSNKILTKCGGLPVAITSIARLLIPELTEENWDKVCKLIESGLDGNDGWASLRSVLLSGYYNLPSNLRSCLLYISIFPRDCNIRRNRLVWRWIGEGFVQEQEGTSLFELGQRYFDQLLNTSLIEEVYLNDGDGMVKYCRVHDVVFWLICSLASEENFVTIFHGTQHTSSQHKVRRLSIQCSELEHTSLQNMRMSQVRSVTVFGPGINLVLPFSSFGVLRVVDFEGCDLKGSRELEHLGKLLHLRYLGLRDTRIPKLPKEIGSLRLLQMLDLFGTQMENLPSTVTLLRKLMCLYVERETRLPDGMGDLACLEELSKVSISIDFVKSLRNLTEMRVLGIVWQKIDETLEKVLMMTLGCLPKMRTLEIYALSGSSVSELQRFVTYIEGNLPQVTVNLCSANASACDVEVATNIHPILSTTDMSNDTDEIQSCDGAENISTVAQEIEECFTLPDTIESLKGCHLHV
uniref:Uncharacterized protein n=1 Tax=Avena sativa TaxID=4498 RepID=A0ACD5TLV1_AVESA